MEGIGLDLQVLEKKDKDELLAIATAMGQKVSARNKKADILQAIVTAGDPTTARPAGGDSPAPVGGTDTAKQEEKAAAPDIAAHSGADSGGKTLVPGRVIDAVGQDSVAPARRARPPKALDEDLGAAAQADSAAAAAAASSSEEPPEWSPRGSAGNGSRIIRSTRTAGDPDSDADTPASPVAAKVSAGSAQSQQAQSDSAKASNGAAPAAASGVAADAPARSEARDSARPPRQGQQGQQGGQQGQQGQQRNQGQAGQGQQWRDNESRNPKKRRRGRDRDRQREWEDRADQPFEGEPVPVAGLVDLRDDGFGFLRTKGYLGANADCYIPTALARRMGLRKGDHITGGSRPQTNNEKYPGLLQVDTVNGLDPEVARRRPKFEDLTPLFPDQKMRLETLGEPGNMTSRIVDLISPIGKGQRGLIVSPPKAGKTTVMKQIAKSIERNNPEVHLMVLLVDERPEEVTDMRRTVKGEVIASTFDRPADEHTAVAELCIERAKRLVEMGRDVVIILDGITRLARAYNLAAPATGRIMSGGVDSGALYPPKKFFGAARNVEEGGSLTILATALVETGSKMDEVIFEEFKGTGNMELKLDRRLAERRLFPAIDVNASSTRHEELLFDRRQLDMVWRLRRVLNGLSEGGSPTAGLDLLMERLKQTKSNDEFLAEMAKAQLAGGS